MSNYESFLEDAIPRSIPSPSPYIQNGIKIIVPEVSLMFDKPTKGSITSSNNNYTQRLTNSAQNLHVSNNITVPKCVESYQRCHSLHSPVLQENYASASNIKRKQVRFENQQCSPITKILQSDSHAYSAEEFNLPVPGMLNKPTCFSNIKSQNYCQTRPIAHNDINPQPLMTGNVSHKLIQSNNLANNYYGQCNNLNGTNSNNSKLSPPISNDLDLSILEVPVSKDYDKQIVKYTVQQTPVPSYTRFKELYDDPGNNVASSSQYQVSPNFVTRSLSTNEASVKETSLENKSKLNETELSKSNNVNVSELFEIIKLQNEKINVLTQQVQDLVVFQQKEKMNSIDNSKQEKDTTQPFCESKINEDLQSSVNQNAQRISIGVMTSLQISFDNVPGSSCSQSQQVLPQQTNIEEQIQNVKDNDNTLFEEEPNNTFLALHEIRMETMTRHTASPENSIHLEMKEYSESEEECSELHVGWTNTILNNVLARKIDQVNDMFQRSPKSNMNNDSDASNTEANNSPKQLLTLPENVTSKTIDQLKRLGVSFADVNISATKRVTFDSSYTPEILYNMKHKSPCKTDQSIAINAMALKYITGDDLGQFVAKKQLPFNKVPPRTENDLSLATIQYMEKYNIFNQTCKVSRKASVPGEIPKILDITALKQQAKLL